MSVPDKCLTPTHSTLELYSDFMRYELHSPTESTTSIKKLHRKQDTSNKLHSSRNRKESLNTVFAGFYSPNHFQNLILNTDAPATLRDPILATRRSRPSEEIDRVKEALADLTQMSQSFTQKKSTSKFSEGRTEKKENEENLEGSYKTIVYKNKKLEEDLLKYQSINEQLQQKVHELTVQARDLQKRLLSKEADTRSTHIREKKLMEEVSKLRHENQLLEDHGREQQNEVDSLDRKYLEVQIQLRQMRKNKDVNKKDQGQLSQKIASLEAIIIEKDQEFYKLISHNERMNCQMRNKEQKLFELENSYYYRRDAMLEHTNKKLRSVNKELMHRVNSLLSSSRDSSDVEFQLSPER